MLQTLAPIGAHRSKAPETQLQLPEAVDREGEAAPLSQAAKATAQSDRLRRQLAPFAASSGNGFGSPVAYPDVDSSFPRQLSGLAAMLAANLPLRCVAITAPGEYDTHADQPQALADGLDVTARTLLAFQRDLEARGLADRVLTLVWSDSAVAARRTGATAPTTGRPARRS